MKDYQRILFHRNLFLKNEGGKKSDDDVILEALDQQLAVSGLKLITLRKKFVSSLSKASDRVYRRIWNASDSLALDYESSVPSVEDDGAISEEKAISKYCDFLKKTIRKDRKVGFTTAGPHRDDMTFTSSGRKMRFFASSGQQRAAVLSLKIAFGRYVKENTENKPIYIFDDPFGIFDGERKSNFREILRDLDQRIITHAASRAIETVSADARFFRIIDGSAREVY